MQHLGIVESDLTSDCNSNSSSDSEGGGVCLTDFPPQGLRGDGNSFRIYDNSSQAVDSEEVSDADDTGEAKWQSQCGDTRSGKEGLEEVTAPVLKQVSYYPPPPIKVPAYKIVKSRRVLDCMPSHPGAAGRAVRSTREPQAMTRHPQRSDKSKAPVRTHRKTETQPEVTMEEVAYISYADKTPIDPLLDSMVTNFKISNSDPDKPSPTTGNIEFPKLELDRSLERPRIQKETSPVPAYREQVVSSDDNSTNLKSAKLGHIRFPSYDVIGHIMRDRENHPESYVGNEAFSFGDSKETFTGFNAGQNNVATFGSRNSPSHFGSNGNVAQFGGMNNVTTASNTHPSYGNTSSGPSFGNLVPIAVAAHNAPLFPLAGYNASVNVAGHNVPIAVAAYNPPVPVAGHNVPVFGPNSNVGPFGNMQPVASHGIYPVTMGNNGLPAIFGNQVPTGLANLQHFNPAFSFGGMFPSVPVNDTLAGPAPSQSIFGLTQSNTPINNFQPRTPPPRFVLPGIESIEEEERFQHFYDSD